ncbi:MAG: methionine--tRNA ligase [Candidatus Shikimatogenerans bostrichidophilus]|nr:MAG: methionine--tRNA ligase [Candidatus Shikimatogenerans bostrichidophilus]
MKKKYIITAAFPYTNGYIHIGHLSGVFIPADIYSRYLRSIKKKIIFISGSDEYGTSILIKSLKEKKNKKKLIDKYHFYIKKYLSKFNISLDNYYRTSDKLHHNLSKKIFKKLFFKNFFIKKKKYQYYDNYYKLFLADKYIKGTCPYCKNNDSLYNQCYKCGKIIKKYELLNPISILSKKKPILKLTYNFYISFEKNKKIIKNIINNFKKRKVKKNVINTMISFLKKNLLEERSITRDLNWGIKLPIKKNKKFKKKVLYVWFESLIGYLSCTIDWAKKNNKKWQKYWKNKNNILINFIGKDNIIFHSILLPIIYKNFNKKLIIPYNIPANEFLNFKKKKISKSKSKKNNIYLHDFLKFFPKMQDSLRYSLIMDMPEKKDTNFTWEKFVLYNNSILVGILGNFLNRVIIFINKYFNNKIPKPKKIEKEDLIFLKKIKKYPIKICKLIKKFKFRLSLCKFIELSRLGNKYLSDKKPWDFKKKNINKIKKVIYISSQIMGIITHISYIFLPRTNKKLLNILNIKKCNINNLLKLKVILPFNHKIKKAKLLFKKIIILKKNDKKKI